MTTAPTATVEIDTIDSTGKPRHVTHAATRSMRQVPHRETETKHRYTAVCTTH